MSTQPPTPGDDGPEAILTSLPPSQEIQETQWQGLSDGAIRTFLVFWVIGLLTLAFVFLIVGALIGNTLLIGAAGGSGIASFLLPLARTIFGRYFR